jgi:hypothetical protein
MTLSKTMVTPHPARQFVDWVDTRFEQAEDENVSFAAFALCGWTVVVARRRIGERLQRFVAEDRRRRRLGH